MEVEVAEDGSQQRERGVTETAEVAHLTRRAAASDTAASDRGQTERRLHTAHYGDITRLITGTSHDSMQAHHTPPSEDITPHTANYGTSHN